MVDELLVVFRELEATEVLEVGCVLFFEQCDLLREGVDGVDWGRVGLAELFECVGSGQCEDGECWRGNTYAGTWTPLFARM